MGLLSKASVMLVFLSGTAMAHEEGATVWDSLGIPDPVNIVILAAVIAFVFIAGSMYYQKHMGKTAKRAAFLVIAVSIAASTLYLSGATVYLNLKSATGGPVHWHADYEVWACGVRYELVDPTGFDNRVGPPLLHEHTD